MKPQRFEIGQAVTPKYKKWYVDVGNPNAPRPRYGEVYRVRQYQWDQSDNSWYIAFYEIPGSVGYWEEGFDPVVTDAVLSKELESITKPVEV